VADLPGYRSRILSAVFNKSGTRLVTTIGTSNNARLWDAEGRLLAELEGHSAPIYTSSKGTTPGSQQSLSMRAVQSL
jgi:WD40 repeat protein